MYGMNEKVGKWSFPYERCLFDHFSVICRLRRPTNSTIILFSKTSLNFLIRFRIPCRNISQTECTTDMETNNLSLNQDYSLLMIRISFEYR